MNFWSNQTLRKWRSYVLVVVGAYILTLAFGSLLTPLRANLENLVFDQYQRWQPRPYAFDQPVRIVDIDDESIHLIGRWPWPRQTMAQLVEALAKAHVAAIGFDVLFSEADRPSGDMKACMQGAVHAADAEARCQERVDGDVAFAHAIADRSVVLGVFLTPTHNGSQASLTTKAGFSFVGDPPNPFLDKFNGALAPIPALADPAAGLGFLNWLPDNDRVIRRVPLLLDVNGQIQPSLALETLRVAEGASGYVVKSAGEFGGTSNTSVGVEAIKVGDLVVPVQADGNLRVWFASSDPRRLIPAWKVLQPDADISDLAGKLVFVGASATTLSDIVATPLNPSTPGVEAHAQLIEQILSGVTLERPDWARAPSSGRAPCFRSRSPPSCRSSRSSGPRCSAFARRASWLTSAGTHSRRTACCSILSSLAFRAASCSWRASDNSTARSSSRCTRSVRRSAATCRRRSSPVWRSIRSVCSSEGSSAT